MRVSKSVYPSTARLGADEIIITEKINGNNLVFAKTESSKCYVATRRYVFEYPEDRDELKLSYKGLQSWLNDFGKDMFSHLVPGAVLCGEWIGENMNTYPEFEEKPFIMFAKARATENLGLSQFNYDPALFIHAFEDKIVPGYMGVVPVITRYTGELPTIQLLDEWYEAYTRTTKPHALKMNAGYFNQTILEEFGAYVSNLKKAYVEGFVIHFRGTVSKYVRRKNGREVAHDPNDHKSK